MASFRPRPDDPGATHEPTFILEGQPYVFDPCIEQGGPELIERALFETYRRGWGIFADWTKGLVSDYQRERETVELILGGWKLRDLLPDRESRLPNASLIITH